MILLLPPSRGWGERNQLREENSKFITKGREEKEGKDKKERKRGNKEEKKEKKIYKKGGKGSKKTSVSNTKGKRIQLKTLGRGGGA